MLASRTNLPASGVSLNDYEESASEVVTGNMPYMASVPVKGKRKGKGKGKTLIMQSSPLPYFIRNEELENEHLPMEVDSTGVDPPNNGASANSPYIAPNPNDAPDVSDDPVTTEFDPWTVSQEAFLAAQPDDSALWRDAVIYNVRAHVPDGPVDELLNFTDPEPSIPVALENDLCSRIYRDCCLLYHSLPEERKVRWKRPRIRASSHSALIQAYQELRTSLIVDGGVLPPDDDNLRADQPMIIMGWS